MRWDRVLHRAAVAGTVVAVGLLGGAAPAFAHEVAPARGAPLSDIIPASIVAALALLLLAALAIGHRRGVFGLLVRLGDGAETATGLPGWAGVPLAITTASLLCAVFGFYWDVSWHIDRGRDPGPFANPAHWFIIVGLAGIALAGVLGIIMGDERLGASSVRVRGEWRAPLGAVLISICGVLALAGFPLDDAWHRVFGQDVTLWGPTHIQMIGGAALSTLAMWVLSVEARRCAGADDVVRRARYLRWTDIATGGAFLIGLSALQGEFDYGVPQFRLLYQPVLIMLAAGIGLVAVRVRAGRGAAVGAAAMFIGLRAGLALLIAAGLGRSTLHFPLYVVEALVVEAVAWCWTSTPAAEAGVVQAPVLFGLWCGIGIGTVGLAAEWAWSHLWMPIGWPASLVPEAAVLGVAAAAAGGVLGGWIGRCLASDGPRPGLADRTGRRGLVWLAAAVAFFALAWPLPMKAQRSVIADVTLTDASASSASSAPGRWVNATVRIDPPSAPRHAAWFNVTAWQGARTGDGGLVIAHLRREGDGSYMTSEPVPVHGEWKAMLRLQRGRAVEAVRIYLPADEAIPAPEVPASAHFARPFVADKAILQREAIGGTPGLQRAAYTALFLLGLCWIASLAWGLARLEAAARRRGGGAGPDRRPARDALVLR